MADFWTTSLLRDRDFRLFISGRAVSEIGTRITREGLPLVAILAAGATAPELGVMAALTSLPMMFLGPFAGVTADRRRRRPILIFADVVRALLLFTVPVAAVLGRLTFVQMVVVAAGVSALTIYFRVADQAWVPSFVTHRRLAEGNTYIGAASGVGEFVGPTVMGALIQGVGGPMAVLFDGISYLVSAATLVFIKKKEDAPAPLAVERPSAAGAAVRGLRVVLAHPVLRPLVLVLAAQALFGGFFETLYEIYALHVLHLTPFDIGLLVTSGGFGSLVASALMRRVLNRLGIGVTIVATTLLAALSNFLIPFAGGVALVAFAYLFGAQLLGDFFGTIFEVAELTLRQKQAPDRWLGRVNGSVGFAQGLLGVLGALVAGVLAGLIGSRDAFFISAVGELAAVIFLVGTPVPRLRQAQAYPGTVRPGGTVEDGERIPL